MIVSPGSRYTEIATGRIVEVLALQPFVLYSPLGTYNDDFSDARIFQLLLEDFLQLFSDGSAAVTSFLLSPVDNQELLSPVDGQQLIFI